MCRSVPQMPTRRTFSSASSAAGFGVGADADAKRSRALVEGGAHQPRFGSRRPTTSIFASPRAVATQRSHDLVLLLAGELAHELLALGRIDRAGRHPLEHLHEVVALRRLHGRAHLSGRRLQRGQLGIAGDLLGGLGAREAHGLSVRRADLLRRGLQIAALGRLGSAAWTCRPRPPRPSRASPPPSRGRGSDRAAARRAGSPRRPWPRPSRPASSSARRRRRSPARTPRPPAGRAAARAAASASTSSSRSARVRACAPRP